MLMRGVEPRCRGGQCGAQEPIRLLCHFLVGSPQRGMASSGAAEDDDDADKLDRSTLQMLIGSRPSSQSAWMSAMQAGVLLASALGLGFAGFQIGYRRALQAELKDDPALKLRQTGAMSGLTARELAARAFVRGSVLAFAGASVMGVGLAYAFDAVRPRNDAADALAQREAENQILEAWADALRTTGRGSGGNKSA